MVLWAVPAFMDTTKVCTWKEQRLNLVQSAGGIERCSGLLSAIIGEQFAALCGTCCNASFKVLSFKATNSFKGKAFQKFLHSCKKKMVLYGYLPAPQRQSRDAASPGTTQPGVTFLRILCTTHKYNKRQVCKYQNVKPEMCTRTDTMHNGFTSLYCRMVLTPFTSRKATCSSPYNQTTNITFPHTHTQQIKSNDVLATHYTARQTAAKCTHSRT